MTPNCPTPARIREIVKTAIGVFATRDMQLLHLDVNERSIAHRVAIYIENQLGAGWHVDCEYNRNMHLPKSNPDKKLITPDVVAHRRNSPLNCLGLEFKKSTHSTEDKAEARTRVYELTSLWTDKMPQYCHAAALTFPVRDTDQQVVLCEWFHRVRCGSIGLGKPKAESLVEEVSLSQIGGGDVTMQRFMVEATVSLKLDAELASTRDRRIIKEWLNKQFYHHDNDFTIQSDGAFVGRVMAEVEIDLSLVTGLDLPSQLRCLHAVAKEALAKTLGIGLGSIWQVDVLITD